MEVIISHVHLDLDGFASMVLVKKLHPNARLVFSGNTSKNVKEIATLYQDVLNISKAKEIDIDKITKLIVVDTSNKNRIGKFKNILDKDEVEVVIYDHHAKTDFDIKKGIKYHKSYGSNTAHLIELILKQYPKCCFKDYEAIIGLMGIYEDTGNFTFSNTTAKDMEMAAYLMKQGVNLKMVLEFVNKNLKQSEIDMLFKLIEHSEIINYSVHRIFITKYTDTNYYNSLDILVNKLMDLEDCDACFIIYGFENDVTIIARSSSKDIKLDQILKIFGGGGHTYAGSAYVRGGSIDLIYQKVINSTMLFISEGKKAEDIMKSPVKIVEQETRIKDVYKIMLRFGYTGIPIMNKDKLVGIISRRDIDKAMNHGFANAPARAYMSSNIITAKRDTPVELLKKKIIENEIGRVPILENEKLIGIVTRTDILRSLYEQRVQKNSKFRDEQEKLKDEILKEIPSYLMTIFKQIESISKKRNERVFLVGGIVRDLILKIPNFDVDIVIEGDGLSFADELGKLLKAKKIVKHEKFKTAVVIVSDNLKIDIATSRIEYYEYPTSLPIVEYGSIKQDLYRRDFTINAMALELDYQNFGKIIDYYNGYKDLMNGEVKILHNLSFIEDPTRVIRAIRFAARYNFKFGKDTEKFLKQAVKEGFLNKMSWQRVKNELIKILSDRNPEIAIFELFKNHVFETFPTKIELTKKMEKDLKNVKYSTNIIKTLDVENWIIYLLIILENLNKEQLDFMFELFKFKTKFIKKYDYGINMREELIHKLEKSEKLSELYFLLHKLSDEILVFLHVTNKNIQNKIEMYVDEVKNAKPLVTGKHLKTLGYKPGETFKELLRKAFAIQLDNSYNDFSDIINSLQNYINNKNN